MTIRELIGSKPTNIKDESFEDGFLDTDVSELQRSDSYMGPDGYCEGYFVTDDYVIYCYEGRRFNVPEMKLVVFVGHETVVIFNTETKKIWEDGTR